MQALAAGPGAQPLGAAPVLGELDKGSGGGAPSYVWSVAPKVNIWAA